VQTVAKAQATLIPAGTLLHCTTDDPNLSPKTAEVGDPVLCHLSQFTEFGRMAFPRGSYLAGHIEAEKQPGHFVGKGYLQIVFDRIGLPNTDSDLSARVVAAQGQHVDNQGRIIGHGHARRDAVEWLFPPLWPWKVITLPARGPQPRLKNEQQLTLKLMTDVEVPQLTAYSALVPSRHEYPQASTRPQVQAYTSPLSGSAAPALASNESFLPHDSNVYYLPPVIPAQDIVPSGYVTLIALRTQTVYPATDYWVDGHLLFFVLPDGLVESTELNNVNWQRTTDLNVERSVRVTLRTKPGQLQF